MRTLAFLRLIARPSVGITVLAIAAAMGGVVYLDHTIGDQMPRVFFTLLYNVAAFALLIAFGGFVGRAMTELERVQLSRVIPGLRRRAHATVAVLVPVVSGAVTWLILAKLPQQFAQVSLFTYWALTAFALALGLGLSGSWILITIVGVIALKLPALLPLLRTHGVTAGVIALGGACGALGWRHVRFLPPLGSRRSVFSWLKSLFAFADKNRRGRTRLRGGSEWPASPRGLGLSRLMAAGIYERFGRNWTGLLSRTLLWVAIIHALFGAVLYTLSSVGRTRGANFAPAVFTSLAPTQAMIGARGLFAALTGCVAYLAAVMLDTTTRPNLWHPVPRAQRAEADFCSRLRQNLLFAGINLAATVILFMTFTAIAGASVNDDVLLTFALPSLTALVLMPIPQALFPNGADTFRHKVDPVLQLSAGVLGGLFCLVTVYWAFHWPLKSCAGAFSPTAKTLLVLLAAAASHAAYYLQLKHRYARADLRRRVA